VRKSAVLDPEETHDEMDKAMQKRAAAGTVRGDGKLEWE
jgi:hypothetical protein